MTFGNYKNNYTEKVVNLLKKAYPSARIILRYKNPWQLLVAVILSAQCKDAVVNQVTKKLFVKYKTLDDYAKASPAKFEEDIKPTGFFRNKAKNILACAKILKERFNGKVPDNMDDLLTLPGVARKTANIVLGNAYHIVEGIAVDTHVHKVSQRLRLVDLDKIGGKKKIVFKKNGRETIDYIKNADTGKIEKQLMEAIPKKEWFKFTYLAIDHGRLVCKAKKPECKRCILRKICPSFRT